MLCWSVLLLCIKLLAAAAQDSEELQKEYQERFSPRVDGEGPPENVTVIGASTTSLLVSWDPPPLTPEHYVVDVFGGISEVVYDTSYVAEGLQVCSSYIVTVTSYYRDNQYPGPLAQGKTQSSVPPPPQDCKISEPVKGKVQVQWKDPDFECSATNHSIVWTWDVLWSDEEGSVEIFTIFYQYTLSDVTPYSNVTAEISAGNDGGFGTSLNCSLVTSQDKPGAPVIVNTASYEAGSATLTWTPPVDANGIILNYNITSKSEEGSTGTVVDGTVLTTVFEDLHECKMYSFSVAARTVVGYGPESEESSVFISGNVPPPPPQDCEISEQVKGTVQVQWKDPDFECSVTNHSIVWTWDVLWSDEEGSVETFTTSNQYTLSDVTPYSNVTVEISAGNNVGFSTSLTCSLVTSQDIPGAPVIVNTTSYEAGSVTLTWTPPVDANGIILNYKITSKSEESSTETVVDGTVLTTVIEDLHQCEVYNFSVAARTAVGYGPESEESSVFISGNVLPPPPQDCEISEQVKGKVQVQWKDPDFECSVTNHSIVWTWDVLWSDEEGSVETSTTSNQYTLSDVTPYSNVTAEISAGNDVGFSASLICSLVTSQDKPGAPVIVNTASYEAGSATLTWIPPVDANGIILNYKITSKNEEGSTETVVDGTVLTTVIEDLHQCESYNFSVAARTVVGYGPESEESSVFISGNVLPPPPQDCEISEQEKGTVQVQWKDPDFACGITNHSVVWTWDVLWTDEEGSVEVFTTSNQDTLYDVQFYTNVTAEIRAATYGGLSTPLFCWVVTSPDKMFDVESKADA